MVTYILLYILFVVISIVIIGILNSFFPKNERIPIIFSLFSAFFIIMAVLFAILSITECLISKIPDKIFYLKFWNKNKKDF